MIHKIINISSLDKKWDSLSDRYECVCLKILRRENDRIAYLNERQRAWDFIEIIQSERYVN